MQVLQTPLLQPARPGHQHKLQCSQRQPSLLAQRGVRSLTTDLQLSPCPRSAGFWRHQVVPRSRRRECRLTARKATIRSFQPASPSPRCFTVCAAAAQEIVADADAAAAAESSAGGVARLRGVRGSASKFRRVLDVIRGRTYADALMILEYLPYRAKEDIVTTLISAASNASNNEGASKRELYVSECYADEAGMYKRFQPRAKGRPFQIQVKKSHLTIKVATKGTSSRSKRK